MNINTTKIIAYGIYILALPLLIITSPLIVGAAWVYCWNDLKF
jgi:hypothetical protein